MIPRRLFAATLAAGVLSGGAAAAQEQPGFASNHFNPSDRGSRWFALDSLDIFGDGRIALGIVNDYSYRSVVGYRPDGTVAGALVENQLYSHLGGSVILADRIRIGLNVPLQLYADGDALTINGVRYEPASDVAVGDLRLSVDARLFGERDGRARLALGGEFMLPSGSTSAYTGDGEPRVLPRVLFAGEASSIVYAAKLGYMFRGRDEAFGNAYIGNSLVFAASVGVQLADKRLVVGPELFGSTVTADGRAFEKRSTPIEALLGAHYDVGENLRVGAGIGTALAPGYGAPAARGLLSLEWVPGSPKAAEAEPAPEPPPPADRDGDGIPDCEDACGWEPGPRSSDPTKNGCPPADADKDGIPDEVDACPLVPGVASEDPAKNGCPADTDGDGVPDDQDACPNVAGIKTLDPKTNGCPDPDRDKDGIPNEVDACPDQAGKPDPDPKKHGCPTAFLDKGMIRITEQVRFKTGSAEIAPGKESQDVLEAVLAVLKANPEVKRVRIEGHTDDRGDAAKNKALSKARASSVAKWLAANGIDEARLGAEGFGPERPIETNATDEGRAANRRVEFHVEEGKAGGSE